MRQHRQWPPHVWAADVVADRRRGLADDAAARVAHEHGQLDRAIKIPVIAGSRLSFSFGPSVITVSGDSAVAVRRIALWFCSGDGESQFRVRATVPTISRWNAATGIGRSQKRGTGRLLNGNPYAHTLLNLGLAGIVRPRTDLRGHHKSAIGSCPLHVLLVRRARRRGRRGTPALQRLASTRSPRPENLAVLPPSRIAWGDRWSRPGGVPRASHGREPGQAGHRLRRRCTGSALRVEQSVREWEELGADSFQ